MIDVAQQIETLRGQVAALQAQAGVEHLLLGGSLLVALCCGMMMLGLWSALRDLRARVAASERRLLRALGAKTDALADGQAEMAPWIVAAGEHAREEEARRRMREESRRRRRCGTPFGPPS